MTLKKLTVGRLKANCYLVKDKEQVVVIDPGAEAKKIIKALKDENLYPQYILATHGHFDHVGAVNPLKKAFPDSKFFLNAKDFPLLKQSGLLAPLFGELPLVNPPLPDGALSELNLPGWKTIATPGHSPGSSSFFLSQQDPPVLFSGDTLFESSTGRYDFPGGNKKELKKSLEKLLKLPPKTKVYPGHGKEFLLSKAHEFLPKLLEAWSQSDKP